jgi:hypothetical protein
MHQFPVKRIIPLSSPRAPGAATNNADDTGTSVLQAGSGKRRTTARVTAAGAVRSTSLPGPLRPRARGAVAGQPQSPRACSRRLRAGPGREEPAKAGGHEQERESKGASTAV